MQIILHFFSQEERERERNFSPQSIIASVYKGKNLHRVSLSFVRSDGWSRFREEPGCSLLFRMFAGETFIESIPSISKKGLKRNKEKSRDVDLEEKSQ